MTRETRSRRRRTATLTLLVTIIAVFLMLIVMSSIPVVQNVWGSPSGRMVAVVENSLLTQKFLLKIGFPAHPKLYIYKSGKPESRQFIGNLTDSIFDRLIAIGWNEDDSALAIANTYDSRQGLIVIVDLNDKRGSVTISPTYQPDRGITEKDLRAIIDTQYTIRTPVTPDRKWLFGLQSESGHDFGIEPPVRR